MAKRLMVLLGMLALALTASAPAAFAQEQAAPGYQYAGGGPGLVTATGVLGEPYTPGPDPTPVYPLTDEATGTTYTLFDAGAGLGDFVGQRVTVQGTSSPGIDPLSLDVTSVSPAGPGGPAPGSSATFTYKLTVQCEPPAGAEFFGFTALESLVTTPLTDPDGDGVYTGTQTVPRFAPGGPPEPITISPVRIVQGPPTVTGPLGPEFRVIKDFGAVLAEDRTLSASVSFCDGGTGGAPVVSGDTNNAGGAGGSISGGPARLPATGGVLPVAVVVGAVLLAGGLIARRISR